MAEKIIYIHAGIGKTASTSIQKTCIGNRINLQKQGLCYPSFTKDEIKSDAYYVNLTQKEQISQLIDVYSFDIINGRFLKYLEKRQAIELMDKVISDFLDSDYDKLLLSEEWLLFEDISQVISIINKYKDKVSFKFIVYIREVISWTISSYIFFCNINVDLTIDDFINYYSNFSKNLEKISKILDKKNIIITPFDKSYFPDGDIIKHFFDEILGINSSHFMVEEANVTVTNMKQAEAKKYIRELFGNVSTEEHKYFENKILEFFKEDKSLITKEELDHIYHKCHNFELEIIKEYFNKSSSEEVFGDKCYDYWLNKVEQSEGSRELTEEELLKIYKIITIQTGLDTIKRINQLDYKLQEISKDMYKLRHPIKRKVKKMKVMLKKVFK